MHQNTIPVDLIVAEARAHDTGHGAVIATDLAGQIVYWSESATALYGWPAPDVVGRNVLDVLPTYSAAEDGSRIMEQLRRGESWAGPFMVRHRTGQPIIAHVTDFPVRSGNEVIGIIGVSKPTRPSNPPG